MANNQQWRVYKPTKDGKGAASKVELRVLNKEMEKNGKKFNVRDTLVFWVSAPQVPSKDENAAFAWGDDNSKDVVTLKMGEPDIGEVLAVLGGLKKQAGTDKGIYHQNEHGSTSFTFETVPDRGYKIRLASKRDGKLVAVQHTLNYAEGKVLEVLLKRAVEIMYNWN